MSEAIQVDSNLDLENVNPADPKLFSEERILPFFTKMRAEQPVHYCKDSPYGPFWSVTHYDDIMAVDKNHGRDTALMDIYRNNDKHINKKLNQLHANRKN